MLGSIRGSESPDDVVIVGCHHDACGLRCGGSVGRDDRLDGDREGFRDRDGARPSASENRDLRRLGRRGIRDHRLERMVRSPTRTTRREWRRLHQSRHGGDGDQVSCLGVAVSEVRGDPGRWTGRTTRRRAIRRFETRGLEIGRAPRLGDLGGGSDHVGFLCHLCIPSISLGAGGSAGTSYHSNYDTLAWYRSTVGEDYDGALMLTRLCAALTADLADAAVLPIEPAAIARDLPGRLESVGQAAEEAGLTIDLAPLHEDLAVLEQALLAAQDTIEMALEEPQRSKVNAALRSLERAWGEDEGLPGRAWFRNVFATSNRDSGYGAVVLPLFREAIVDQDQAALDRALQRYQNAFLRLAASARAVSGGAESALRDS